MSKPLQHQHTKPYCPSCGAEGCECSDPGAAHEPLNAEAELARMLACWSTCRPYERRSEDYLRWLSPARLRWKQTDGAAPVRAGCDHASTRHLAQGDLGSHQFAMTFSRFATRVSRLVGSPWVASLAFAVVAVWAALGPVFGYSDGWQLVINTGTTIVTFLMVFLIQNAQNRDSAAIQLKLDEMIRATERASNALVGVEDKTPDELDVLRRTRHA